MEAPWKPPWHLTPIIEDIYWLASGFEFISWYHIFKETNFVADKLAHVSLSVANPYYSDYYLPALAMEAFHFDFMGNRCIRGFSIY